MPLRELRSVAPRRLLLLIFCILLLQSLSGAKTPASGLDPSYLPALAAADRFLQAWQSGDVENGMALLTGHLKQTSTTEVLDNFFSHPHAAAYEVVRGKFLKRGRYEFPVVLVEDVENHHHPRRRFSSIVIVDTGNNDWAVDKLP
jgi:hypothetical protein